MKIIEFDKWKPSADNPRKLEYDGQRTAQEVFEELKHRLEGQGYLPDEYFEMRSEWEDGREIPRDADLFCTVDYGASEGVYVDVYLKWHDEKQGKDFTESFITGKTLGENGNDLDRMFLTASAITKAVHGDHAAHARYMKIGGVEEDTGGRVVHLSQQEEKVIIEALVEQRERQEEAMSQTEQLLRRMTGGITAYMDTVGQRPLRISDYDKAVLAIRDGDVSAFKELYPKVLAEHADDLLIETAGRPGEAGVKMMAFVLSNDVRFSEEVYQSACRKAVDISDTDRTRLLLAAADHYVPELSPSFHGEVADYAWSDHRHIAREIIKHCGEEQIAAAPPQLLERFSYPGMADYEMLSTLVEKGISGGGSSADVLRNLTRDQRSRWMAKDLLETRMWVTANDYSALHVCVENDAVDAAKLLLDGGMNYDRYRQLFPGGGNPETVQALEEHWAELQTQAQEQGEEQAPVGPEAGGMQFG